MAVWSRTATTPEVQQFGFQGLCSQDSEHQNRQKQTPFVSKAKLSGQLLPANILQPFLSNLHKVTSQIYI